MNEKPPGHLGLRGNNGLLERVRFPCLLSNAAAAAFTGMLSSRNPPRRTAIIMYFLNGRQGTPFPIYILENLKCSFIPTALPVKLWQLTLPFLSPHVLMGCESEIMLEAEDKGLTLLPKDPFPR